jgi:integrase
VAESRTRATTRPAQPENVRTSRTGTRFVNGPVIPAAAAPTDPQPHGDLRAGTVEQICTVSAGVWNDWRTASNRREQGIRRVLEHLQEFPGDDWPTRWAASGLDCYERPVRSRFSTAHAALTASMGAEALFCLRVIRPALPALRGNRFTQYPATFRVVQADPQLDAFFTHVAALELTRPQQRRILNDICVAITVQGVRFAELTPAAVAAYSLESRALPIMSDQRKYTGHLAWEALCSFGLFPPDCPRTLQAALLPRQATPTELVDRYGVNNPDIRELLIAYLQRRSHDMDYRSLTGLATNLVKNFWAKIETIRPGQPDLRLDPDTYEQWRSQVRMHDDGITPRVDPDTPLMAVRSFYFDLQAWAAHEPERWGRWAAACPVRAADTRGGGARRRRINERMAARTRLRQPLLPLLVAHVEHRHQHATQLLAAATAAGQREEFDLGGHRYRRVLSRADQHRADTGHTVHVRVVDETTGQTVHVSRQEEATFWDWAIVEVLRHTGLRVEELTELSHLSIRQYQRPNGEVVALLVVAPSKSDRERVIPMSAELFHTIAMIVRRLTRNRPHVPLVTAFDHRERVVLGPLPLLFQRPVGGRQQAFTGGGVHSILKRLCAELARQHPEFAAIQFSPHDFRRIFATELVNSGLPIHIGAALLGHLNIETTRGYIAVFAEDVVAHYQTYLANRRTLRPTDEYGPVTDQEWAEFEEHFDKRKVELGTCARPYQAPCHHEHACIRCPMLHLAPHMLTRLDELETDLLRRQTEAHARGWLGELEGLQLTLKFLRDKREQAHRLQARPTVNLGIPPVGQRTPGSRP